MSTKVELEIIGKDKASGVVKGVTSTIIAANLAVEGLKIAANFLKETISKGIEEFKAGELALQGLKDTVGGNVDAHIKFAEELQKVTTVEDDAAIAAMKYGANLGITKDRLNEATKDAIGLSKAFGVDLNMAMKMTANAYQGNYDALAKYIPALKTATDETQKQAIVNEAMARGFRIAEGEANTFTGALMQLENAQGSIYEDVGNIVAIVGKDLVKSFTDGANSIHDFLSNTDNVATIGATFKTITTIIQDLGKNAFGELKKNLAPVKKSWDDLVGSAKIDHWQLLGGALQFINAAVVIQIKFIKTIAVAFIDFIKVIVEAGKSLGALFDLISGKKSWDQVKAQLTSTGAAVGNLASNFVDNTKDMIDTAINEVKTFGDKSKVQAENIKNIYNKTFEDIKNKANEELPQVVAAVENTNDTIVDSNTKTEKKVKEIADKTWENMSGQEKFESVASNIQKFGTLFLDTVSGFLDLGKQAWDNYYADQLRMVSDWKDNNLALIDEWVSGQMERMGVVEETENERLQREIDTLTGSLETKQGKKNEADIRAQIKEKQDQMTRNQILDEGKKKEAAINAEAKKKETDIKKKQFEENKTWQIANVWINAATSVMGWWASFAPMGVAGVALAAVMTAATLAMAGVQTGLIAGQSFHGEQGGIIPTGNASGDNTMLYANKGEALLRSDDYNKLIDTIRNPNGMGNTYYFGTVNVYANDPIDMAEQLKRIAIQEGGR
jgi:hypothetical protein